MIVLQASDLRHAYIVEPTFDHLSFVIQEGEKIGLIGPNGAGKTTLFKCLTGELPIEAGQISLQKDCTLGYLEQRIDFQSGTVLLDALMAVFDDILDMRRQQRQLEEEMSQADGRGLEDIYDRYADLTHAYEKQGGYSIESRVKGVIQGLGFTEADYNRPLHTFSGGERTRLELAALLVREPDILLLDVPTNHLDIKAVDWLEGYLKNYKGSLLLISHDRYFLDQVTTKILELDHGRLTAYPGNYSRYLVLKREADLAHDKAVANQQQMLAKEQAYIEKNRAGRMAKQARGREKKLARLQILEKTEGDKAVHFKDFDVDMSAKIVLDLHDLYQGFDQDLLFSHLNLTVYRQDKIGIIGPNGCGKSSLLKTIIGQIPPVSGEVSFGSRVHWSYFDQEQSRLDYESTVLDQILYHTDLNLPESRSELAKMLFFESDWDKQVKSLSGGEKARLSLLMLLLERPNFIIMDEPTNHLDIASKQVMEAYLKEYPGTLLIVSHDRYFLDEVTDKTWAFDNREVQIYYGNYSYYREKLTEQAELAALKSAEESTDISLAAKKPSPKKGDKNKLSKSKLRDEIAQAEKEIAEKEDALEAVEKALLEAAQNYSKEAQEAYEVRLSEKDQLEADLENLYHTWSTSSELLEALVDE